MNLEEKKEALLALAKKTFKYWSFAVEMWSNDDTAYIEFRKDGRFLFVVKIDLKFTDIYDVEGLTMNYFTIMGFLSDWARFLKGVSEMR